MTTREVRLELERIAEDTENQDMLVFRSADGHHLSMSIGPCEGFAIRLSLNPRHQRGNQARPMTHDLLAVLLDRLGAQVEKVVIDDFWRGTFFAKLLVSVDGTTVAVDARPSDAVAIALRSKAAVYATDDVLEQVTQGDTRGHLAPDDAPPTF